jgi:hypothetical protein
MTNANEALLSSTAAGALTRAVVDGFDADAKDPTASPIRGANIKFKDGSYYAFSERIDVRGKSYAVMDKQQGWQKLEGGCPPEYLMRKAGEPKPPQPYVDEGDWPLDLNGVPEHPWKFTTYLPLLDIESGEISTFWTNTVGGDIAVGEITDQIAFMRTMRPAAIPVIALEARDFPTRHGGTKPRPYFHLLGWRERSDMGAPAALTGPDQNPGPRQQLENFAAEKPANASEPTPVKKAVKTSKRGATRIDAPKLTPVDEPSMKEVLDDEIGF